MPGMKALRTAAPYLSRFRDQIFVVKLGGETMESASLLRPVLEQVALLWHLGIRVVIVHGGGSSVDRLSDRLQIPVRKVGGRRVTSEEAMEAVKMTLAGSVQVDLLSMLRGVGLPAVGLRGLDAGMIIAHRRPPVTLGDEVVDFGAVGDIERVHPELVRHLLSGGFLPVVAPLTGTEQGEVLNTNADTVAASLAVGLGAEKLIFVMKAPGLCRDVDHPETVIPWISIAEAEALVEAGIASGGMAPKITAARRALEGGVDAVQLVGGGIEDGLLLEVFTNEGAGTMIQP